MSTELMKINDNKEHNVQFLIKQRFLILLPFSIFTIIS
jgi:hypothetical protein